VLVCEHQLIERHCRCGAASCGQAPEAIDVEKTGHIEFRYNTQRLHPQEV
jgi:hypothetical protein